MTARYIVGDTRAVLATLEPGSVDLVLTSPPFLALRSYLPADHPDKTHEIGSEPTPGAYIDTLLDVVEACARVLAPHGTMMFELGDTYAGSGGAGGDYNPEGLRANQPRFRAIADSRHDRTGSNRDGAPGGPGWPLDRSLCLIPELFRISLVYGFNPLTRRQTPRWRARNVVRWCRPNPPVGALGDKFRPATSELVVICRTRRYYDLDAVRTPHTEPGHATHNKRNRAAADPHTGWKEMNGPNGATQNPAGAPPLDWWKIPTQPYEGAHYATWPEQLCVIPVKAMCPARVCRTCGKPSQRIVSVEYEPHGNGRHDENKGVRGGAGANGEHAQHMANGRATRILTGSEWSDCGHDNWRPGVVLDPFAGSGTTLKVATGHGRDAIGIDLDHRNAELALGRVGPLLLSVETVEAVA